MTGKAVDATILVIIINKELYLCPRQQNLSKAEDTPTALILKILRDTKSHPTADWIYNEVRKEIPDISLGTVYRNLRLLKEMEIQELQWGSTYSRFDGNPEEQSL